MTGSTGTIRDRDHRPSIRVLLAHTLLAHTLLARGRRIDEVTTITGLPRALVELVADELHATQPPSTSAARRQCTT